MKPNKSISIVIPAYNETERFSSKITPLVKFLNEQQYRYEIIIVDDGSTDNFKSVVSKKIKSYPKCKLISYKQNMGKGYAVKTGVIQSKGDYVLFMDADLSTPIAEIPRILTQISGFDIVIGSRGIDKNKIIKKPSIVRRIASKIFDETKFLIVGLKEFKDTQCGFKLFKGEVARSLFENSKINRFMFDVEILYLAKKKGLKIKEFPVSWQDMPGSKVRVLEGVISMIKDLVKIRLMHQS